MASPARCARGLERTRTRDWPHSQSLLLLNAALWLRIHMGGPSLVVAPPATPNNPREQSKARGAFARERTRTMYT